MKTYKNLFSQVIQFKNILEASYKAAKGKRERPYVMDFFMHILEFSNFMALILLILTAMLMFVQ